MSVSQIKVGAVISYASIGVNFIIGLLYTPWMIHSIGKENYGLFVLATSVISLFMFDFGLGNAVTRFVSRYLAEGRQDKVNNFMGLVEKLYLGIDAILLLLLVSVYFFIPSIYQELTPQEIEKFKVVYAIAACFSVFSFPFIPLDGLITAHERFVALKLCELFNRIFIVSAMALCLIMGYGLYALVTVNAIAGMLTILLKWFVVKRYTQIRPNWKHKNKKGIREIVGYSWWVTVGALSQRMVFNIAPTILGTVAGSVEIALFGIAMAFEGYVFTIANALNGLFLPKVTKITLEDDREAVLSLMTRVGRIQIIIIGLIIIGFVSVGADFISLWLGDGYDKVYVAVVLLIIPSFFHLPQLIGSNAILAMNKVKKQACVFVCMGLFNLIVGFFMAAKWGSVGFSISVFLAYLLRTVGMDIIFYRDLHIDIFSFFKDSFLKMGPAILISAILGYSLSHYMPSHTWLLWVANVVCVSVLYIFIMYVGAMNQEERNIFLSPLKAVYGKIRRS